MRPAGCGTPARGPAGPARPRTAHAAMAVDPGPRWPAARRSWRTSTRKVPDGAIERGLAMPRVGACAQRRELDVAQAAFGADHRGEVILPGREARDRSVDLG